MDTKNNQNSIKENKLFYIQTQTKDRLKRL